MRTFTKAGIGAISAALLLAGAAGTAYADNGAQSTDFVAVGSDTVQNAANFLFDGDQHAHAGFNFSNKSTRIFDFDATGDEDGRAMYPASGSAGGALPVTSILRVGTLPVIRPNGSGAGIGALISDSVGGTGYSGLTGYNTLPNGSINIVRASRLPKGSENAACVGLATCGGLHVYQFAYDNLQAAVATTTNAPLDLTGLQLAKIFECDASARTWNQVGGTSTNTIIPVIPQSGSGTRNFFIADLTSYDPAFALGSCVVTGQEHDPASIFGNATPADVIMPFSTAKIQLINNGYFGAFEQNKIKSDYNGGANAYNTTRGLYFVVRDYDITHAAKYSPAATSNIFTYLFGGSSPWVARASQQTLIQSAGLSTAADPIQGPAFQDLGNTTSG